MIQNFLSADKIFDTNSHGGVGKIQIQKVFRREDLNGVWDFALRVIMPPSSSMGLHKHLDEEEMYIILNGQGVMTLESETKQVSKGGMILNKPFGEHGLVNNSDNELELLIIQASNK